MTRTDQLRSDADEVLTSAPPLPDLDGADPEETFDGHGDESEADGLRRSNAFLDRRVEDLQEQLRRERARADAAEREVRVHREGHRGALAGLEEARARIAGLTDQLKRAEASELLYENTLEMLAEMTADSSPSLGAFTSARDAAKTAGFETRFAEGYANHIAPRVRVGLQAEARIADLEAQVSAERDRASACIRVGLDSVPVEDLLAAIERRGFQRPVPAAAVPVTRDDAGDDSTQDAAQGLR